MLIILLLFLTCRSNLAKERVFKFQPRTSECGLSSCGVTKPGYVNVHLVPHSHDDTGWLKNVDEYFYGAKQQIQRAGVQYILDSVVRELANDPSKKFIQVETAFFWRWWMDKDDYLRNITRQLVEAGQIEFTGGGWSMNDEATTHYASIIDNMEFGLNWLVDTFGSCAVPTIAWQIDPFGHTKEQARLFAEMGFEGLFFARIDHKDKDERKLSQSLQMWWEGGQDGEVEKTIFTGVFDNHYSNPEGFCWDIICTDEPINDNPMLDEFNVDERLEEFQSYVTDHLKYMKDQAHIMFTMGDDFQFQDARMNYKNMDKLIYHMNLRTEETGIHLLYSTPSCYLDSLRQEGGEVYPIKSDDFLPYASSPHSYWTGFFTSRPSLKLQDRLGARDLSVCRQMGLLKQTDTESEFHLHRAMGLMQHHDAVTGTEKQAVADDYSKRLYRASQACQEENIEVVADMTGVNGPSVDLSVTNCPSLNISQCLVTESSEMFIITVYNPVSWSVSPYIRVPVPTSSYQLYDSQGSLVEHQVSEIPDHIKSIPGRDSLAEYELIFRVDNVPALGFTQIYVKKTDIADDVKVSRYVLQAEDVTRQGALNIPGKIPTEVELLYYEGSTAGDQPSGAYVFRPKDGTKYPLGEAVYSQLVGSLLNETVMSVGDWGVVSVREYQGQQEKEITWQVGPIPGGYEAIMVFTTDIKTEGSFFTDSNGRQMMKRIRKQLEDEPESGNYYPVTNRIELRGDDGQVLTVVTDRSEGGSSLLDGQMELMVHRRCTKDDYYGVGEALEEEAYGVGLVARGQHFVVGGDLEDARLTAQEKVLSPQMSFFSTSMSLAMWMATPRDKAYSALTKDLPASVQVLTLSKWKTKNEVLIRFHHVLDEEEGGEEETVNLIGLFTEFEVIGVTETSLAANQPVKETDTEKWTLKEDRVVDKLMDLILNLNPGQIRTFVAAVQWN